MKKLTLASTIAATLFSFSVHAEGLYVEGSVGKSEFSDESATGFGILMGYDIVKQGPLTVSGEASFNQYGTFEEDSDFGDVDAEISSFGLGTKVAFTIVPKFDIYGRMGYERVKGEFEISNSPFIVDTSDEDITHEFSYAIGASYEVVDRLSLGAQFKKVDLEGSEEIENISVTANYSF